MQSQIRFPRQVQWHFGFSADLIDSYFMDDTFFNPMAGVTWELFSSTTVRAAAFRNVQRSLISEQTIQPTQVAGFNQLLTDREGSRSWRYCVALDRKFSDVLFGGAEFSTRDGKTPVVKLDIENPGAKPVWYDWDEDLIRAYLYWAPAAWMSFSAEYFYETQKTDSDVVDPEHYRDIETHRFPASVNFFHRSGLSSRIGATYVDQQCEYIPASGGGKVEGSDRFWVFDLRLSYRLPKRLGILSFEAKKRFRRTFQLQGHRRYKPGDLSGTSDTRQADLDLLRKRKNERGGHSGLARGRRLV